MGSPLAQATYVLPIRRTQAEDDRDFHAYLAELARMMRVIVVDGSPAEVFAHHARLLPATVAHVPVDADRAGDLNGKVAGTVTGLRRVLGTKAIVADDDVRYDEFALRRLVALLDRYDVVRPQNVFAPAPWHAVLDEGRSLIARATGGDWPGTLGIRMASYRAVGGYDGDVLFENLELVRTLRAAGARELIAQDLFVARRPPTAARFWSQRVRQAYDELARPRRFVGQLALAPVIALLAVRFGWAGVAAAVFLAVGLAELGRRRGGATRAFPLAASLCAPIWVLERAVTAWIALGLRVVRDGVRYSHGRLRTAAHSERSLRALNAVR